MIEGIEGTLAIDTKQQYESYIKRVVSLVFNSTRVSDFSSRKAFLKSFNNMIQLHSQVLDYYDAARVIIHTDNLANVSKKSLEGLNGLEAALTIATQCMQMDMMTKAQALLEDK